MRIHVESTWSNQAQAYKDALASDPESAFGSIICFNEVVTLETAEAMTPLFIEVVMALVTLKRQNQN